MSRHWSGIAVACIAMVVRLVPAPAQSVEEAVKSCATEPDDQRRLACYDRSVRVAPKSVATPATTAAAVAKPAAPPSSSPAAVTGTSAAVAPVNATAGAGASTAGEFGVRNGPLDVHRSVTGPKEIAAVVTGVHPRADGALLVELDNGQSWVENQPNSVGIKAGDTVRIRTAALGSYMLYVSSNRFTHVTRVR